MAQASVIVTNFTGGEQSEKLHGRVDLAKYANGCRTLENFIPLPQGGASRRHGMEFVNEAKDSSKKVRLVPFEFSVTQAYVLEFGNYYMRVYKDGAVVVKTASDTSAWVTSTAYSAGDFVKNGSPSVIYRCIQAHTSGSTTEPGVGASWSSYWVADATYELVTPYSEADLPSLSFAQSADTLYVAHSSYEPRQITRTGHNAWTISAFGWKNGPFMDENDGDTTITVSSYSGSTGKKGETVVLTASASLFSSSDVGRWVRINYYTAGVTNYVSGTGDGAAYTSPSYAAYGDWDFNVWSNGSWDSTDVELRRSLDDGSTWSTLRALSPKSATKWAISGREDEDCLMRVYKANGGTDSVGYELNFRSTERSGLLRITAYVSATVVRAEVLEYAYLRLGSPFKTWSLGSWGSVPGWPRTVTFHQDRLFFGGTSAQPQTVWGSKTGDYVNFETGEEDDSALNFTLVANDVNYIRWMVSRGDLVIGTASGEWVMKSYNGPLTPTNVQVQRVTTYGSDPVSGILTHNALIFVQRGGKRVRLFQYDYNTDAYFAADLNLLADHVTQGTTLTDLDFAKTPEPILWTVRSDGQAPLLTLMTDQQVIAWSRVVTDGTIESVAIIPDEVWLVVNRTIGGATKRYIERITEWDETLANARFLDSHLTYSGTATTTLSGLSHLEGETVSVFDGASFLGTKTVSSGSITLDSPVTYAVVGLPYTSTLQTNPLELPNRTGTSMSYNKRIIRAIARLYKTIGGDLGYDSARTFPMATGSALYTGDIKMEFPKGYSTDQYVYIVQDRPYPMTVTAIIAEGESMER